MELEGKYGIPKDAGGDSPENVDKMHRCVEKVMKGGKDKEAAIRICKSSMFGQAIDSDPEDVILAQAEYLQAVGKMISSKNLTALKQAVTVLQELIDKAETMSSMALNLEGLSLTITEGDEPAAGPFVSLDGKGNIEFTAGERLGQAIQRAREAKFLTREQLSEQMTIGPNAIAMIECGMTDAVPDDVLKSFSDALGLDLQQLEDFRSLDTEQPVGNMPMGGMY